MSRHVYSPLPLPEKIMPARPRLTLALRRQKSGLKVRNEGSLKVLLEGVGQYLLFPDKDSESRDRCVVATGAAHCASFDCDVTS